MESEGKKLFNVEFIQVESVKALVAESGDLFDVPQRYIRPELEADDDVISDTCQFQLPVIDLQRLKDPFFSETEVAKLGSASADWGFFQLVNHGVREEIIDDMKNNIMEFFMLPLEQKKDVAIAPGDIEGFGQHFVMSNDQKLDWGDLFFIHTQPVEMRNLKVWPSNPQTFRDTVDKYSFEMKKLLTCLLEFIAKDMDIEPDVLYNAFKPQSMRMNCYPPCPQAEKVLGLSAHTDGGGLTLLVQNDVQGLQTRKDGKWFSVEALPGAIVVNIGNTLEIISNGKYRSVEHRAVINTVKERISIATFNYMDPSCTMGPLPEVVKGGKENYKTVNSGYNRDVFSAKLQGRNYVENMRVSN
ncbi:hypothetical protein LUZ60_007530 [Juncus effusus]|nr:hypothetical protein LUZ60_007530 [Juncus effusus]